MPELRPDLPPYLRDAEEGAIIAIKAVPGAKRDQIAGPVGDRLKARVAAPPEGGKANAALCALLAGALGVRRRDVQIISGATSPEKEALVRGLGAREVAGRLG